LYVFTFAPHPLSVFKKKYLRGLDPGHFHDFLSQAYNIVVGRCVNGMLPANTHMTHTYLNERTAQVCAFVCTNQKKRKHMRASAQPTVKHSNAPTNHIQYPHGHRFSIGIAVLPRDHRSVFLQAKRQSETPTEHKYTHDMDRSLGRETDGQERVRGGEGERWRERERGREGVSE
jgi:hypothetical protein